MSHENTSDTPSLFPARKVCERYDIGPRTLSRWEADESLGFAKAVVIRGRRYFPAYALEEFDRACATKCARKAG